MKFTVERKALIKMLQCVGKKHPTQTRRDKQVRLYACAARVFVEANHTTAGTEAMVLEDGACFTQQAVFLKVLKTYTTKNNVTIEAGGTSLKFFSTTLPITDFSRTAIPPGKFQVFPVTDLTVLRPQGAPPPPSLAPASPPLPEPEPPPAIFHRPGTFPIAEDEMHLVQDLIRLTRRLCALPTAAPQELVGLAHALYALERLPQVTNGVSLEFSLGHRSGTEDSHTETDAWVHIEGSFFILGTTFRTYDTAVGGDHHSTIVFQVKSNGFRSTEPGDEAARLQVLDWINQFASLLDHHSPDELTLSVTDASAPDFMPELDGE